MGQRIVVVKAVAMGETGLVYYNSMGLVGRVTLLMHALARSVRTCLCDPVSGTTRGAALLVVMDVGTIVQSRAPSPLIFTGWTVEYFVLSFSNSTM